MLAHLGYKRARGSQVGRTGGRRTMGSTRLWLPSRRSVASQRGALTIVLLGHCLSGRFTGGNGLYLVEGSLSLRQMYVRTCMCAVTLGSPSSTRHRLYACCAYIGILDYGARRLTEQCGLDRRRERSKNDVVTDVLR